MVIEKAKGRIGGAGGEKRVKGKEYARGLGGERASKRRVHKIRTTKMGLNEKDEWRSQKNKRTKTM